jgi:hypothetical protein
MGKRKAGSQTGSLTPENKKLGIDLFPTSELSVRHGVGQDVKVVVLCLISLVVSKMLRLQRIMTKKLYPMFLKCRYLCTFCFKLGLVL